MKRADFNDSCLFGNAKTFTTLIARRRDPGAKLNFAGAATGFSV